MCKTLIVEDNTSFRQVLTDILRTRFPAMPVAEERDGSELFPKIDTFHPNIIFMDIRLPGESGLELTRKIKMSYPDIVVVILTSYDLPEYRHAATQSRADYFVSKDSPSQEILALVESVCFGQKNDLNHQIGLS
jgi:DNA-binding NarL/FixJ family response regulator